MRMRVPPSEAMGCRAVGPVLVLVTTLRALVVPLPAGCDERLDEYATTCSLPRFVGEPVLDFACAELRAALEAGCPRWRHADIGPLVRRWLAERAAARARRNGAVQSRWVGQPGCTQPDCG
jgi:hypothetical protein